MRIILDLDRTDHTDYIPRPPEYAFLLFQRYQSQKFTVQIHLSLISTVSIAEIYGSNSSFSYFNRINRKNLRFKFIFLLF